MAGRTGSIRKGWVANSHDKCPGWLISKHSEVVRCERCKRFAKDQNAKTYVNKMWSASGLPHHTEGPTRWLGWGMHPADVKIALRLHRQDSAHVSEQVKGDGKKEGRSLRVG